MATVRQYHFVLSEEDDNSGLKAHMDEYAKQKKLTARIKTALTLLAQLEQGNTEMLDSMFPQIRKTPTPETPPDANNIEKRLDYLQKLIEQGRGSNIIADDAPLVALGMIPPPIRQLAAHVDDDFAPPSVAKLSGLKKGSGRISEPPPDDEDTIVVTKKEGDMTATYNFLSSFGVVMDMDLSGVTALPDA